MTRLHALLGAIGPPALALGVLSILLALTTAYALAPHWPVKPGISIAIALLKASVVLAVFMRLDRASALIRLTAAAGWAFMAILFVLGWADYVSRLP